MACLPVAGSGYGEICSLGIDLHCGPWTARAFSTADASHETGPADVGWKTPAGARREVVNGCALSGDVARPPLSCMLVLEV